MRLLLVVLGATVAAVLAGASAAPAVAPTPTSTDGSSVSAARPLKNVSYLFTAEFGMGYEVDWTEESGSPFESCGVPSPKGSSRAPSPATPMAVLLDEHGRIASPVLTGGSAVLELLGAGELSAAR